MSNRLEAYIRRLWDSLDVLPGEDWKPLVINGAAVEHYMISTVGRVVSLPRERTTRHGDTSVWPGKLVRQHKTSSGQQRVNIQIDGVYQLHYVNDLVASTFGAIEKASVAAVQMNSASTGLQVTQAESHVDVLHANPSEHFLEALGHESTNLLPAFLQRFDREQTRRAYRNDLQRFFGTSTINADLANAITFLHVNEHIQHLEADGIKPSTIKRRVAALRGFFDWLEALELITRNPTKKELLRKVRNIRSKDRALVVLSARQAEILLAATEEAGRAAMRDYALLLTLLHCVLRRSEAAAMDVEHIRSIGHYWIVDLPNTKGGADQYVKLPAPVAETIEEHRSHYRINSGALWCSLSNNGYGNRLSTTSIYNIVRRTAERAGLSENIGAHTLRHTGCTLAIENGASLQQVQTHARHKNIETTLVYVHQRDKLRDSAADYIKLRG